MSVIMVRYVFLYLLRAVIRVILSLRYRVEVRGGEVLKDPSLRKKGVLVLPNHTAEIEPFMILSLMGLEFDLHPLVVENFYHYPFAKFFMKLVRARPVAEFDKAISQYKLQGAEKLFQSVVDDLKGGEHILLYPAAGLKVTAEEKIGGRSLAHATIQQAPDTEILLIRITGLWGSLFSKAYTGGETPHFWRVVAKGFWILLKNFLFFAPRRKVILELEVAGKEFPKFGTKWEFNKALEDFYNQYPVKNGERVKKEPLNQVPYQFWSKKVLEAAHVRAKREGFTDISVPNHIRQDIIYQLSELSGKSVKNIHDEDDLVYDVGLDSLNIATLFTYLDTHYDLEKGVEPGDLKTVSDLFAAAIHVKKNQRITEALHVGLPSSWPKAKKKRPDPLHAPGETIIEVFLSSADRMKDMPAIVDAVSGVLDYKTMKRAVVILAGQIKKLEGEYIGVMLPSSVGAFLTILAIMLAGKVPVPLNWTVGSFFMNHAINLMEIKHIISSERFLERLDNVELGKALEKILSIETIRKNISLKEKIFGALLAKRSSSKILRAFGFTKKGSDDLAVVLFTSGTTALPKSVPLTHKNILTNHRDFISAVDLNKDDVLMMALPPFHIFGFTCGLLPLLMGIRVVCSPDPLDGSQIAKEILKWRVTVNIMAPTFFSHLFRVATLSQLKSLRICVSGAEKASDALMQFVHKLGDVAWIEGYGLTETSPVIAVNTIYARPRGVGKVLPSIELIVRDPESGKVLAPHQIGEICVAGESIFSGYYKQDNQDTFFTHEGKRYYKTGDLGYIDEDRYLYLEGRLKLSFKRGGEMINVVAIENALFNKAKEKGWVPQEENRSPFACIPKESPQGGTRVVLFSTLDIPLDQINNVLFEAGFARLYKVNELIPIKEIPFLKTGKVCYRKLFEYLDGSLGMQKL